MNTIWWIRRDLRLNDNPAWEAALQAARTDGGMAIPLFVRDPILQASPNASPRRLAFLEAGLSALRADLLAQGVVLQERTGDPLEALARLRAETGAGPIYAEADASPYARWRDSRVAAHLPLQLVGSPYVLPPGAVLKPDGRPYTVFTPFSKAWKARWQPPALPALPPAPPAPSAGLFPAGEAEALRRLHQFTAGSQAPIYRYAEARNLLDESDGVAFLSPYLRLGMISAQRAAGAAWQAMVAAPSPAARQSAETWLNELIWREFYGHILYHFPAVLRQSFRPQLRAIPWENDPAAFAAWQEGRTGYPLVDAAMRQLAATGWMHNRARMVVASFLSKDLLIDWRWGERWFMQQLLDGDPAANNGGWQWSAGTGTDAAPYFRIFSPVAQSLKFAAQGVYIRQWLPELARLPLEHLHAPWQMSAAEQRQHGVRLGAPPHGDYPLPIVDHALARERVLAAYRAAGSQPGGANEYDPART